VGISLARALSALARPREHTQVLSDCEFDQTIIRQGEATDSMYFVVSGTCRVLKRMDLDEAHALKLAASPNETRPRYDPL